tara:strand:- start:6569 stop:7168 length:600 start_codon:yes stop_codon:yes gene_type:complete
MILDFLYTFSPFIYAYFVFFIFSYLLFNKIFKLKWNIFIHVGISILLITITTVILYSIYKKPEQKEEVISYLKENKQELIEIKIEEIEKKEINLYHKDNVEVFKITINNEESQKANLHQIENIYQTNLLLYSNEAKDLFKNKKSFFVSKEKLPFINNKGLTTVVYYFCNNLSKLSCVVGKPNVIVLDENKNKVQVYTEF